MPYANNQDTDQLVHPHNLISACIICCLDRMRPIVALSEILIFLLMKLTRLFSGRKPRMTDFLTTMTHLLTQVWKILSQSRAWQNLQNQSDKSSLGTLCVAKYPSLHTYRDDYVQMRRLIWDFAGGTCVSVMLWFKF